MPRQSGLVDEAEGLRRDEIGRSAEGRPLYAVTFGQGPATVLLWSQMHGDEPSHTMGLADLFAFFAREVPGFFFSLGTQKPGTQSGGHHTPTFMADDSAIPVGIRAMSAVLLDYLSPAARPEPPPY